MSDWYRSDRDREQGRYGSEGRTRRDFDEQDRWRDQGQRESERRSFGERRPDPARGGRDFRGQEYGRQSSGSQSYGGQGPIGRQDYEPQRSGGGAVGMNPAVQRVADGDADHIWRENVHMGEHRGRGPKNYTRSDERIREDVSDRLCDDSWLDASEIEVQVSNCEVILTGTVQSREDKHRAEDLAERVSGVKHLQNNLRVEPHPTQNPRTIPANAGGSGPPVT